MAHENLTIVSEYTAAGGYFNASKKTSQVVDYILYVPTILIVS